MELTRRDATAALAAVGATGGVALAARREGDRAEDEGTLDEESVRASMVAVATVVYPSAVDGVEAFVNRFLDGRLTGSTHADGRAHTAVSELDDAARSWHGVPIADLSERATAIGSSGRSAPTSQRRTGTGRSRSGFGTTSSMSSCWRCTRRRLAAS